MRRVRKLVQPGRKPIPLPEAELKRLYIEELWTTREIAQHFGVSQSTVARRLRELGVRMRRMAWV